MSSRGAASGGGGGRGRGRKFGANRSTARTGRGKKNSRAMREMRKREPQLVEGEKNMLVFKGPTCSEMMISVLRDLSLLRVPCAKRLTRKNPVRPFEAADVASLEFLCNKNDCALFAHATHSKKRPQNLTLGRTYNDHLLDMVEFGVDSYQPIASFSGFARTPGSKPMMVFVGHEFEHDTTLVKVKDLLLDMFRGRPAKEVCLAGIDHLINVSVVDGRVCLRTYAVQFKKSGSKVPRVVLSDMGPHMDLSVRRTHFAAPNLAKLARKQAKQVKPPTVKNVTKNAFGDKVGRVHMLRQDYGNLQTRKLRGLKKRFTPAPEDDAAGAGAGAGSDDEDMAARPSSKKRARR